MLVEGDFEILTYEMNVKLMLFMTDVILKVVETVNTQKN